MNDPELKRIMSSIGVAYQLLAEREELRNTQKK